jgi:integrase/recombinase XerD
MAVSNDNSKNPFALTRASSGFNEGSKKSHKNSQEVWMRLEAFLSTRSPNTQVTYLGIMKEWCLFLGAQAGTDKAANLVTSATDLHAIAYRKWLFSRPGQKPRYDQGSDIIEGRKQKSKSVVKLNKKTANQKTSGLESTQTNATIWKKFAALRRMYRVLISAEFLSSNPFDSDKVPPPAKDSGRKRPTEMLAFDLVKQVIDLPDEKTEKGLRDKAILAALFGGGLRRSEIASLRISDFRITRAGTCYLYLRSTKARKDAEQALPTWAATLIAKVIDQRRKLHKAKEGDFIFISYVGFAGLTPVNKPVSHSGIYKLFKQYCLMIGAGSHLSPHSARATAITKLLDQGLSHRFVQEFSRHSSIQMVEVYDKRRIGVDESAAKKLEF